MSPRRIASQSVAYESPFWEDADVPPTTKRAHLVDENEQRAESIETSFQRFLGEDTDEGEPITVPAPRGYPGTLGT